jgi:hypothetical protein
MAEPKVKVLRRTVLSKQFLKDSGITAIADNYVKKTAEFGKLLKEVKDASAELKQALEPKLKGKVDLDAGTDWKALEGDEKGTIIVEVIQRQKAETTRSRIPADTL